MNRGIGVRVKILYVFRLKLERSRYKETASRVYTIDFQYHKYTPLVVDGKYINLSRNLGNQIRLHCPLLTMQLCTFYLIISSAAFPKGNRISVTLVATEKRAIAKNRRAC